MKKTILILSIFILGALLTWKASPLLEKQVATETKSSPTNSPQNTQNNTKKKDKKLSPHEESAHKKIMAEGLKFCPELEKLMTKEDKITDSHTFGHNIHFKKGNEVHRIRIFTEDGAEGSFEKLVYFVEDQDGFPQIRPIDNKKSVNPSEDYILSLLQGTQTIYDSLDVTYFLNSGKSFNASYVNGKITKVTAQQVNCQI